MVDRGKGLARGSLIRFGTVANASETIAASQLGVDMAAFTPITLTSPEFILRGFGVSVG